MGNPVVHFELMSKNPEKVSDFYAKTFGWKVKNMPEISYRIVDTDAKASGMPGINGGIVKPDKPEPWPGNTLCYILVDDLAAYRKKIKAANGKIQIEKQKVPGMGKFSLFTDPENHMMELWKAKK